MKYDIHLMVVEPEASLREELKGWLSAEGYHVTALESGDSALKLIHERTWDTVIMSLEAPGKDGLKVLEHLHSEEPHIPILVMVESDRLNEAGRALKAGAVNYISRPPEESEVLVTTRRIVECRISARENELLKQRIDSLLELQTLIGRSAQTAEMKKQIKNIGPRDGPVLILGEAGVGKEHVAKMIHAASPRRHMPFEAVSLGALPETLVESELFGHEKAAFTGSAFVKKGKLELANFGTLYLDGINELTPEQQLKIEQVMDMGEFRRVDGTQVIRADVRMICGSRSDLEDEVKSGGVRQDLYNRISNNVIYVPPLRERPDDVPVLAEHFLQIYSARLNKKIKRISQRALDFLSEYSWPGNVRELQNAIERAVILARTDKVDADDLPFSIRGYLESPRTKKIKEWEKYHIRRVLNENAWNISKSAKDLGIDRVTLYNKIKKYKLKKPGEEGEFEEA